MAKRRFKVSLPDVLATDARLRGLSRYYGLLAAKEARANRPNNAMRFAKVSAHHALNVIEHDEVRSADCAGKCMGEYESFESQQNYSDHTENA